MMQGSRCGPGHGVRGTADEEVEGPKLQTTGALLLGGGVLW